MTIEERAKMLLSILKVKQVELAKKSGISQQIWSNALRGKQRLNSDHIEFLCKEFPNYAEWLVIGYEMKSVPQFSPGNELVNNFSGKDLLSTVRTAVTIEDESSTARYRIIESVDARYIDQSTIKPSAIKKLVFIQNTGNSNDLSAILIIDNGVMYKISSTPNLKSAVWISPGNMSFKSNHSGKSVLRDFRVWVKSINEDLIIDAEYWGLEERFFDDVYKHLHIPVTLLCKFDNEDHLYKRFLKWKEGKDY